MSVRDWAIAWMKADEGGLGHESPEFKLRGRAP